MSLGQYNEPVRYTPGPTPPPRRTNYVPWLLGCGGCVAIIAALIGWLVYSVKNAIDEFTPEVREARMISGEQLAWRELPWHPANMIVVGTHMRSIEENGDSQRELIFFDSDGAVQVVDLDGNVQAHYHWSNPVEDRELEFWDFDGDGIDEMLYDSEDGADSATYVANLDEQFVHEFAGMILPEWRASADVDGDGRNELLLHSWDSRKYEVVNQGGKVLIKGNNNVDDPTMGYHQPVVLADMDGDGVWSVLYGDFVSKQIHNGDNSHSSIHLPEDPMMTMGYNYEIVMDIGGDGPTELINEYDEVFYDAAAGMQRKLRNPLEQDFSSSWLSRIPLAVMDHDDDGEAALWTVPGGEMGTELVAYGPRGNVVYHEAMQKYCAGIEVIERSGVQYLVVCAFDKVLVYP